MSSFKILSSSSGGSSMRKLFGKSSSSEVSASQKFFDSKDSGSVAPQIGTLNMTRASFSSAEKELPGAFSQLEKKLPQLLLAAYNNVAISRKPVPIAQDDDSCFHEKLGDIETALPTTKMFKFGGGLQESGNSQSWHPQMCPSGNRRNETNRAHYDLYPR